MEVNLNETDILSLQKYIPVITDSTTNNKRNPDDNRKDPTTPENTILFSAFNLSTKRVGFSNGTTRVTTAAYEIRYHPAHTILFKSILIQASVLDPVFPSDNHIHFVPYGLLQTTDAATVKNQTTQQNRLLTQTGIVPILNITIDTMNSGLNERLLAILSIIGIEPTYLTAKSGKWLVIVKKAKKDQARQEIDQIINDIIFPDLKWENLANPTVTILTLSSCLTLQYFKKKQPYNHSISQSTSTCSQTSRPSLIRCRQY